MKRIYKTNQYWLYIPRHKYKYYVYDKEGLFINTFNTIPEMCEKFNLKENSIRVMFYKKQSDEIKHKDIRIFRTKG